MKTNPHETPEETEHRIAARNTPVGRLLMRMGRDYWDTESAARSVAEHAVGEIAELRNALKDLLSVCDGLPYGFTAREAAKKILKHTKP